MNAGKDFERARKQAYANAKRTGTPRYLHMYGGTWWISRDPIQDAFKINAEESCAQCGESYPCRGVLQGTHTFKH
jgi:hypothetical protein